MPYNEKRNFNQLSERFVQLTGHILMEYVYVGAPSGFPQSPDDLSSGAGGFFTGSVGAGDDTAYCVAVSGHTGERHLVHRSSSDWKTGNGFSSTVMPANRDCTRWTGFSSFEEGGARVWYGAYDPLWCESVSGGAFSGEDSVAAADSGKDVYDLVRLYFQSGYVPEYDGFVVNLFSRNLAGAYFNLITKTVMNTDTLWMLDEPLWHADKIYTNYVEFRVPSVAFLSDDFREGVHAYDPESADNPMWANLAGPAGISGSPVVGVDLHGITSVEDIYGYAVYCTSPVISTLLPCRDSADYITAGLRMDPEDGGDYIVLESRAGEGDYSLFDYLDGLGGTYTFVHQISVAEIPVDDSNTAGRVVHDPVTFVQTWEGVRALKEAGRSPFPVYRPVLDHAGDDYAAEATYVLRITSNRDGSSIIRECTAGIPSPRKYGKSLVSVHPGDISSVHVYNRVESGSGVVVSGTGNPLGAHASGGAVTVNRYAVSAFIDRRNIKARVSPVKVENVEQDGTF